MTTLRGEPMAKPRCCTNPLALKGKATKVNQHIQFTVEKEVDGRLPFLDTMIHWVNDRHKFLVYRKHTNKGDFIHFLLRHDMRTKSGVVNGFFLRALRICSGEFLSDECNYIVEAISRRVYPHVLLRRLKNSRSAYG